MKQSQFDSLDLNIARVRIFLSLAAMLSLYIDPTTGGGLFHLTGLVLPLLLTHLAYSIFLYIALRHCWTPVALATPAIALDLFFAAAVAFLTEGETSPSYIFFVFAIVAAGVRPGSRATIIATASSVVLYLAVTTLANGVSDRNVMRAVYLAIAGYLIGALGQQRRLFESRAERRSIARSLHDGYVQALAGMNLRLQACRELLQRGEPARVMTELSELQVGVAREYDQVRAYIRSLAGLAAPKRPPAAADLTVHLNATFSGRGLVAEHLLQIMLEGLRNARRHGRATRLELTLATSPEAQLLTIGDDGAGFDDPDTPPWAIASRVAEMGGNITIVNGDGPARLSIEMPVAL
jgi:signal transduction histidine kinase